MAMTEEERYTTGELLRLIQRVDENVTDLRKEAKDDRHRLANDMNVLIGREVETRTRLHAAERDIKQIKDGHEADLRDVRSEMKAVDDRVRSMGINAAYVSGGISLGAWLLSFWPWGHK